MPSRRSILTASSLAISTGLAGCSAITGPPGTAVMLRSNLPDLPEVESAPVVAYAEQESDEYGCPEGLVTVEARVHEVSHSDGRNELVAVTEYDVFTGESNCMTNWGQTGIAVRHDWQTDALSDDGFVTDWQSDAVPTGDDSQKQATLEQKHTTETGDWRVNLTPPTRSSSTYQFVSTFADPGALTDGDILVKTRSETRVRNGWFGGDDVLETEATLTYGDTDE